MKDFPSDKDEELIGQVAKYPAIFDTSSPLYRDQNVKDNAWKEIAVRVGRSLDDCKWRWRNIKDTYNKRKRKGTHVTELAAGVKKKWRLAAKLTFLDQVQLKRKTANLDQFMSDDTDNTQSTCESTTLATIPIKKERKLQNEKATFPAPASVKVISKPTNGGSKKRNTRLNTTRTSETEQLNEIIMKESTSEPSPLTNTVLGPQEDHVDVFFRSVAMSVKTLPNHFISQAKIRTLEMLAELEGECSSTYQTLSYNCITPNYSSCTDTCD